MFNIAKTLHKKSSRDETGLFLIEGRREIDLAMKHGIEIVKVLDRSNTSAKNMERISYCGEIVAVAKTPGRSLRDFILPDCPRKATAHSAPPGTVSQEPLIVVLDNLEKPGNIGAIIRTADAAGVTAVFVCGGSGDLTNPNLIRASLGAVFCLPVFCVSNDEALIWLINHDIPVVTATPDAKKRYFEHDFSSATAIVVGSEAEGVSDFWLKNAGGSITIPMTGEVNSLNVSVSAAILIYEAVSTRLRTGSIRPGITIPAGDCGPGPQ